MTVQQILDASRQHLNAISDDLWSDTELLTTLYEVMCDAAAETQCIDTTSSQNTVASTATYTVPSDAVYVWRLTYNGTKLQKIDRREYDSMNISGTTSSGTPSYYMLEGSTYTLYPTPDAAQALKSFYYGIPTAIPTTGTTLEIPVRYHHFLIPLLVSAMCPKDVSHPMTLLWEGRARDAKARMRAQEKKRKRGDRFSIVKLEESSVSGEFGIV